MNERQPEEQFDIVEDKDAGADIETRVERFKAFWVNNIFRRTFSYLVGWSANGWRRLSCTTAGILKVSSTGTIFEYNDTHSGTAADTYGAAITFASTASAVEIWVTTNSLTFKRSNDGGSTYDDEIELEAGSYYTYDCSTTDIQVKNTTAGSNADYQIVGWY